MRYKLSFSTANTDNRRTLSFTGKMNFKAIKEEITKNFIEGEYSTFFLLLTTNGVSAYYGGYFDKHNLVAVYMQGSKRRYSLTEVLSMIERYDRIINTAKQVVEADFK